MRAKTFALLVLAALSFVSPALERAVTGRVELLSNFGLGETLHEHGEVENELRASGLITPPPAITSRLRLPDDTPVVYLERHGYRDVAGTDGGEGRVDGWLDAFYYATVTLSTTGYGDITPLSEGARTLAVRAGDVEFEARVRIDTPKEWLYYRGGGILHYVLRQLRG